MAESVLVAGAQGFLGTCRIGVSESIRAVIVCRECRGMSAVPSGYTNATPPPFKSTYADLAYCRYASG